MAKEKEEDKNKEPDKDGKEGAEGAPAEGDAAAEPKKKNKKKLILFIALPVLLILGGGAGAYFSGLLGGKPHAEEEVVEPEKPKAIESFVYYDLPEIIVNLSSASRKNTFMKISVSLQIEKEEEKAELEKVTPRIVDKFQVYLRGLQVEDLQGSAGMFRLREELLARVNVVTEPVKIHDVLFKEILIQ